MTGRLSFARRSALRARHGTRLLRDVAALTVLTGAWWLLPLFVLVAVLMLAIGAAQHAVPYAVYTLF